VHQVGDQPRFRNSLFFSLCPLETAGNEILRNATRDPKRTETAAKNLKGGYSSECLEMTFRSTCLQIKLVVCHNHLKAEERSTRRKPVSLIRHIMNAGLINILISNAFTQIEFSTPPPPCQSMNNKGHPGRHDEFPFLNNEPLL
jgi:hypothetical protein